MQVGEGSKRTKQKDEETKMDECLSALEQWRVKTQTQIEILLLQ